MSQLVTTRGTLLNSLLDPDSSQGLRTYEALLCLYASALEKSVESNEFSLQWVSLHMTLFYLFMIPLEFVLILFVAV